MTRMMEGDEQFFDRNRQRIIWPRGTFEADAATALPLDGCLTTLIGVLMDRTSHTETVLSHKILVETMTDWALLKEMDLMGKVFLTSFRPSALQMMNNTRVLQYLRFQGLKEASKPHADSSNYT